MGLFVDFKSNAQKLDPINVVTTAVPFLRISPDARAGGMGDLSLPLHQMPVHLILIWEKFLLIHPWWCEYYLYSMVEKN